VRGFKLALIVSVMLACFVYGIGIGVGYYKWFPLEELRSLKKSASGVGGNATFSTIVSRSDVLEFIDGKEQIECPNNTERLGVLVTFGQSNSANSASYRVRSDEVNDVINFHSGNCYRASSPLLGATNTGGEWMSLTAQSLVDAGLYDTVVVMSLGIGGSPVAAWTEGSELNLRLIDNLNAISERYTVTDMLWHQGESDLKWGVSTSQYVASFSDMVSTVRAANVTAQIFVSIASLCNGGDYPNNITNAQLEIINQISGVELGVNTDELLPSTMRHDNCHFNEQGQRLAANEAAKLIVNYHATNE
jgi:hypothetical protein